MGVVSSLGLWVTTPWSPFSRLLGSDNLNLFPLFLHIPGRPPIPVLSQHPLSTSWVLQCLFQQFHLPSLVYLCWNNWCFVFLPGSWLVEYTDGIPVEYVGSGPSLENMSLKFTHLFDFPQNSQQPGHRHGEVRWLGWSDFGGLKRKMFKRTYKHHRQVN